MKTGDIILTNKVEHRGFSNKDLKATFKSKPDTLMVYLYLGGVTIDSLPHFSPDGALAALGYGPIMTTLAQRKVVDALKTARETLAQDEDCLPSQLLPLDAALLAAENFSGAAAPTIDPILADAARMGKLLRILERRIGASLMLQQILDVTDNGAPAIGSERGAIEAVIDAASEK